MKKGNYLSTILRSKQTVFSFKDVVLLWKDSNVNTTRVRINYYVKNKQLYHIRKGFYGKDKNYDKRELAIKIYTPSYISFETVLGQEGITFQYYNQIFVASYLSREIIADEQVYSYRKIKNFVLTNKLGVENKQEYSIACKERAFLDVIYLKKNYHFDNLSPLNWHKVFEILPIYNNKRMNQKVKELYGHFKT